jgi:hypothetical protein
MYHTVLYFKPGLVEFPWVRMCAQFALFDGLNGILQSCIRVFRLGNLCMRLCASGYSACVFSYYHACFLILETKRMLESLYACMRLTTLCVLVLLYMCPHIQDSKTLYACVRLILLCVSSYHTPHISGNLRSEEYENHCVRLCHSCYYVCVIPCMCVCLILNLSPCTAIYPILQTRRILESLYECTCASC